MPPLSYEQFGLLRLRHFLDSATPITEHAGFEWMNGSWWYEGVGFTWFGRLEDSPEHTAGFELFFEEIPLDTANRILKEVGVPITPGMSLEQISSQLGTPIDTQTFVD